MDEQEYMTDFFTQIFHPPKKSNLPTVFLDRDGTIIYDRHHLSSKNQVRIYKSAIEGIRLLNERNFNVVVVTNQSAVARNLLNKRDLFEINKFLYEQLKAAGVLISAVYSCPHHPEGVLKSYKIICDCRKPKTAMYEKAISDFNTPLNKVFLIGDMTSDIEAGRNLHTPTILLQTGYAGLDGTYKVKPNYIARNLFFAARLIVSREIV